MDRNLVLVLDDWAAMHYYQPFRRFGKLTRDHFLLWEKPERLKMVLFTGGADIHPKIYNDEPSMHTMCHPTRDIFEYANYYRAREYNIPLVGVCRGAQFLCALAGGKLYQHVTGHGCSHWCSTIDGKSVYVSSTHHQMMRPPKGSTVIAWADPKLSNTYVGADDKILESPEREVEVCHFPNINALGMQYHPEMMKDSSPGFKFASEVVEKYLGLAQDYEEEEEEEEEEVLKELPSEVEE